MSHRTKDLPPISGPAAVVRELRYHEFSRQGLALVLMALLALTARPSALTASIGLAIAVVGMLVRLYASGFVMKNKELATQGPYGFVRHPLYTGNVLVLAGFALAGATLWALPLTVLFLWFYYPPAIEYEDRKLRGIFGAAWDAWASRVPALVPRLDGVPASFGGAWSFTKSMRANGEIFIVLYVLAGMWIVIARVA